MEAADGRAERRGEGARGPRQKTPGAPRPRGEPGGPPSGGSGRGPQEPRRRRGSEGRYVGFGDGIERAFCTRAEHILPLTFPVASHAGAATIPRTIVARREGAVLLCSYSHCGAHAWPDGEVVAADETTGNSAG